MNKLIASIFPIAFCLGVITSCDSPIKKVEKANENLMEAKANLKQEKKDSITDYERFKAESEIRIAKNEKAIAEYKYMISSNKRKIKKADQKFVDDLETMNRNIRMKIGEYKENGTENWNAFKESVSNEIDELGKSISRLSGNDKK